MLRPPNTTSALHTSLLAAAVIAAAIAVAPRPADAANVTDLASAFDEDDPFDLNFRIGYHHTLRRGAINRQLAGRSVGQGSVEVVKELRFSETIDTLALRAEGGLWHDLQLHIEFPIILRNSRELSFARNGGSPCGSPSWTSCVTPINSTLARDGFIDASRMPVEQRIVAGPDGAPGGRLLPDRAGLDQFYVGLTWAPMSQPRDLTKPTWALGYEVRVSVGPVMDYDPGNPRANKAVGRGVHELHWWTAVSRRFPYVDTWMSFHYLLPVPRSDSLFEWTRFAGSGQQRAGPQQRAWVESGLEVVPWEQPDKGNKFTVELAGRLEGLFEGRGYSPIWELLARQANLTAPCLANPSGGPPVWDNGTYCASAAESIPYPGITRIENHLNFFGSLALNIALSQYFVGRIGMSLGHEQQHYITTAQAGRGICNPADPDTCRGKLKLEDPRQVNPMYRPLIDAPGRRFQVSETTVFDFFISATGKF